MGGCNGKSGSTRRTGLDVKPSTEGGLLTESVQKERRRLSLSQSDRVESLGSEGQGRTFVGRLNDTPEKPGLKSLNWDELPAGKKRLSIIGALPSGIEDTFETKKEVGDNEGTPSLNKEMLKERGIGYACRKGLKPESPNQDDFCILRVEDWSLYGVFDGHGPYGHDISNLVQRGLPKLLFQHPLFLKDMNGACKDCYKEMQSVISSSQTTFGYDSSLSGTTTTIIVHEPAPKGWGRLHISHVGDSRAIIATRNESGKIVGTDLTTDHKPNIPEEQARIEEAGGVVKRLDGDIPHRVFLKGKLFPGLAMSRAMGDLVGVRAGISPVPDYSCVELEEGKHVFMVLASDGVWEFITNQEAVDVITSYGRDGVQQAAENICQLAWDKWIEEEVNVVDDITIEIVYF